MNAEASVPQPEAIPQLNQLSLPTGPFAVLRPRRERTDEDREWCNEQMAVPHEKLIDKAVFERLAFYGSLNPDRTAFPSMARLSREALCSERSVRYALRRLESVGLIECLDHKGGRKTSRYRVVGSTECRAGGQEMPGRAAPVAAEVLKEGKPEVRTKDPSLSVNDDAQTVDPGAVEEVKMPEEVICLLPFPSKKKQEQESAPEPKGTVFVNKKQVDLLFKLQRKLGYRADDEQAGVFDGLEHADRKRILDKLLAEEQLAAAQGKVTAPPKASPSPRHEFPLPVARNKVRQRPTCEKHRWTPPAADGVRNCYDCDAEEVNDG